jgi:hypothetical protein
MRVSLGLAVASAGTNAGDIWTPFITDADGDVESLLVTSSPTCTLKWNTSAGVVGKKYAMQVKYNSVLNGHASDATLVNDFIIELVGGDIPMLEFDDQNNVCSGELIAVKAGVEETVTLDWDNTAAGNRVELSTQPATLPPNFKLSTSPKKQSDGTLASSGQITITFTPDASQVNQGYSIAVYIQDVRTNLQTFKPVQFSVVDEDVFRCAAGAPGLLFGHYSCRAGSLQL